MFSNDFETKKAGIFANILVFFITISIFFIIGYTFTKENLGILDLVFILLYFVLYFFVSIIVHEFGHMVFGLLTGYKVRYFQILCFKFVQDGNKVRIKIAKSFALGQCLMGLKDSSYKRKYRGYLLGGVYFNLFTLVLALGGFLTKYLVNGEISLSLLILSYINFYFLVSNAIPLNLNGIYNDALNYKLMNRNPFIRDTVLNSLVLDDLTSSVESIKEVDVDLLNNYGIKTPSSFIHTYAFDYARTMYAVAVNEEKPFRLIISWFHRRHCLPNIYKEQNTELIFFYYLISDIEYKGIMAAKENKSLFKKPNLKDPIMAISITLKDYKEVKISPEDAIKQIEDDKKLIKDAINYPYESEFVINLFNMAIDYINKKEAKKIEDASNIERENDQNLLQ